MKEHIYLDDALISTDVDRLIRIISGQGTTDMRRLERETGLDRKSIEKWLHVLEDEGYIHINYRLTNMVVIWRGDGTAAPPEEAPLIKTLPVKTPPHETLTPIETHTPPPAEKKEENKEELAWKEEDDPLDFPVWTRKETPEKREEEDDIRENIRNALREEAGEEVEEPTVEASSPEEAVPAKKTPVSRPIFDHYRKEIDQQKQEIAHLQGEKKRLYHEGYVGLESRMEADLGALMQRVLEREQRLIELKERLVELPDEIEGLAQLNKKAAQLQKEGRKTLQESRERVRQFVQKTTEERNRMEAQLEKGRQQLEREQERGTVLTQANEDLGKTMNRLENELQRTKEEMVRLETRVQEAHARLEEARQAREEINEMATALVNETGSREEEVRALESAVGETDRVGEWAGEYLDSYEQQLNEMESYVAEAGRELDRIRETAETEYMHRYLQELETYTKNYQGELAGIIETEQDVDRRLDEARERLRGLIAQSQDTVRRLAEPVRGESFRNVMEKARAKLTDKREDIQGKNQQRKTRKAPKKGASKKNTKTKKGKKGKGKR